MYTAVKSKGKISQNFVAFSEYMNFTRIFKILNVLTYKSKFGKYLVKSRGYKNMQLYKGTGLNVYMYGISDNMSGVTNWIFYFSKMS